MNCSEESTCQLWGKVPQPCFEASVVHRWPLVVRGCTGRFNRPLFRPAQPGQVWSPGCCCESAELVFKASVVGRWPLIVRGCTSRFNRPLFRPAQPGQVWSLGRCCKSAELVFEASVVRRWPLVVSGSTGRFNRPPFRPAQPGQVWSPGCCAGSAVSVDLIRCNGGRGGWPQLAALPTSRLTNRGATGVESLRCPGHRIMRDALRRCGTGKRQVHLRLRSRLGRLLACRCWRLSGHDSRCLLPRCLYRSRWMLGNSLPVSTYS